MTTTDTLDPWKQTFAGITMMCAGVALLCVNDALAKTLIETYSPLQILFLRNSLALPFAFVLALAMGGTAGLRTYRPQAHALRGVLWICATISFFTGLKYLGLAEATALVFAAPVFITALSAILLRERVGWRRWLAVLVGLGGVIIVVRPGGATFQTASLLPIATAFLYALLMISARWVDKRESVWTLLFYLTATSAVMSGVIVPFVWIGVRAQDIWLFLGVATFGTGGITLITQAFRFAPAAVVAPMDYTALIWATALGWLIWHEIPDAATYLGAGVIIASGVYIVLRERRLSRRG
ncbi:drug/metabolite transporter (DMT)-like permease [Breoghania corrubedonensis]|uniref:Drug/metabolite transporter (DMT)-like permease n=1 Tax=Breoghania corrubedonensis TaxID=665038 RepID=A0A2T5VAW2_9HYPH|nr:DMT family transporter [Breoghania corrubedonensis]PTW60893.1 drug/metabolite transporter (DMT)-like permease [Breoghania corrubedonensis]